MHRRTYKVHQMKASDPQFKIRVPDALLAWLKAQAEQNHRSVTAEIVVRLESSRQANAGKVAQA